MLVPLLGACGGTGAEISGTGGGVKVGEDGHAWFGGPFVVLTPIELECDDLVFVRPTYQEGVAPAELDLAIIQFYWAEGTISTGTFVISPEALVAATALTITGEAMTVEKASAGTMKVESVDDEDVVAGSLDAVVFPDGSVSGTYEAEWCINLKDR